MEMILEVIKTLIFGVVVLVGVLALLLVVISLLPAGNPLRALLSSLSMRVGVTLLAGMIAIPVEVIPGIDLLYDVGVPVFLLIYWLKFFPDAAAILTGSKDLAPRH